MKNFTGVWLDNSKAKIINMLDENVEITTVLSPYKRIVRIPGEGSNITRFGKKYYSNTEFKTHQKKQNDIISYYKEIEKRLVNSENILLFGPGLAKSELNNVLLKNRRFKSGKIFQKNSGKLTEKEIIRFVMKYFSKK